MRIGVDVGGTFTDLVALGPNGLSVIKVPSTPEAPERGIWHAFEAAGLDAPPESLVHGTTVATNALLERKGARVVLVVTAGFEDLLELRRQDRASLYDLSQHHPPALVPRERVVGVRERMGRDGVVVPLAEVEVAAAVQRVKALGPEAIAVSLLFSFRWPEHERTLAAALRSAFPGIPVAVSHELVPRMREYERTSTVAAEAFLRPSVSGYVRRFDAEAARRGVRAPLVLASNGGALRAELAAERAVWLALSGPAGGIQGAALAGAASGFSDLLTLDMGGTSADAGVVLGREPSLASHGSIAGVPLAVPHIALETVSAGGGSIGWLDNGGALRVGPESAGADPGPACYGRGGSRPTVTDAFVVLGWIPDGSLLGGSVRVRADLAASAIDELAGAARLSRHQCALGMVRVAEATMARALRRVSVERGLDPASLTLVAFGGAGPLSACSLAELVGVRRVLLPPLAGALSALGMAAADERVEHTTALHLTAGEFAAAAPAIAAALGEKAGAELPGATLDWVAECRYVGQGFELDVPVNSGDWARVGHDFHVVHHRAFSHSDPQCEVEVVELRCIARRAGAAQQVRWPAQERRGVVARLTIYLEKGALDAAGYEWDHLSPGQVLAGPAVVLGAGATALIPPGWAARVNDIGAIVAEPGDARPH
ncbi:MAG TPA: hydantoinase/oxoprolinase family protein [Gemmatimonadales bacterium]|nr:hydantoinase/oxoprolinase family protein [Gemmatimonadales bacterium]